LHKPDVQNLGNSSKSPPLKHGSIFKSFRGRSAWDVDDDEFDGARKYSIETEEASPEEESMGEHSASLEVEQSAAQFGTQDESKLLTTLNLHGGSFFRSFRGRSPFDADDDEFDAGRKYSTANVDTDEVSQPPTHFCRRRRSARRDCRRRIRYLARHRALRSKRRRLQRSSRVEIISSLSEGEVRLTLTTMSSITHVNIPPRHHHLPRPQAS
jgi:hypothetical protein